MWVLGIESSCDETAASVVSTEGKVLSSVVSSQVEIHHRYGGVVPELASRHHLIQITSVFEQALLRADGSRVERLSRSHLHEELLPRMRGVAVTQGPGLVGSLMVGIQFAKAFCLATGLPLVGVNHLDAHLDAVYASDDPDQRPSTPHIALLVSGGHTVLFLVEKRGQYKVLGRTRDDAAGEAFDKVAKMLGLGYPGGEIISKLASRGDPTAIRFPRALPGHDDLDFSFSGLKTAVRNHISREDVLSSMQVADICASVQEAIVDVLVRKSFDAAQACRVNHILVSGGVAANARLRERMIQVGRDRSKDVFLPDVSFCTDNAVMVAVAGARHLGQGKVDGLDLDARARWIP